MNNSNMINNDFRRMLRSPKVYLSICVGLVILLRKLFPAFVDMLTGSPVKGTLLQFLSTPFGTSDFTPFAAVFCVLPFADSFCEDYNSGYVNYIVPRLGVKKYSRQRCFSVALSGGIIMALLVLIPILFCALLANQPETEETTQFLFKSIWAQMDIILKYHGMVYLTLRILLGFLFGSLWALIGLTISVFLTNRYVTYVAPFVLYQILWFLLADSAFNPVYMIRGDSALIPSLWFILGCQLSAIALCIIISCFGIRKKVRT